MPREGSAAVIDAVALAVFLVSFAVTLYVYFGYPALIFVLARLRPRPIAHADVTPSMSVIVPVFNEEPVIERKIRNTLAVDYPHDRLEVLFVSDGSTDRTGEIVRRFESDIVRLVELPRGGKAVALNTGAACARGEILVFTDANVDLAPDALRMLARPFADADVGGVSGKKKFVVRSGTDTTEVGENLYWRWDQWQKELESAIGSIFAADGTLYAIRRSLYVPIADPAQADDIAVSTRVVLQSHRLVFEPRAIAFEDAPVEGREEFRRKVRVTNHSVRALLNLRSALWTSGFYSVELLSHKLVRHLVPFFLIALFLSSLRLAWRAPVFAVALTLQVAFYALAIAGAILRHRSGGACRLLSVPYYFCLVNAAALLGCVSMMRGTRVRTWSPRGT
jgi:cellulose synthase/poly-beta-1,6-N-acetylglucosamine synthase-like glycosyltransferase